MTNRTEHEYSPIEKATHDVLAEFDQAVRDAYRRHKPAIPEKEFRRILTLYFHDKSMSEWADLLGVQLQEGDQ
jgi:hypothetical protein